MSSHRFQTILLILLFTAMLLVSIHTLTDINQDIGMHFSLGKIIWQTHHIPTTNLFSYTNPDYPSVNNRWLFEILFYLGAIAFGLKALIVFKAIVIVLAFGFAFFAYYRHENNIIPILLGLNTMFILIDRTFLRPEIFSFLFLSLYLYILYRKPHYPWLWLLLPIQVLWINSHIYFFVGIMVWGLYWISKVIKERSIKQKDIFFTFLLIAVNFLNPNGLKGILYPFSVLNHYGIPVLENLSPFDLGVYQYPMMPIFWFFVGIVLVIISFAINRKHLKENMFGILLSIATVTLSFKMVRNMPLFALALMPITMKNFAEAKLTLSKRIYQVIIGLLLILLIIIIVTSKLFLWSGIHRQFGATIPDFGFKAVSFVKANHIDGPMFNNMNAGSFLTWQLPDQKVFFDARPEDYPPDFEKKIYIPMQSDPEMWTKYSEQYHVNYVFYAWQEVYFTHWANTFMKNLTKNPDWPIVYLDSTIAIFVKNTPHNQPLIDATKAWRSTVKFQ